MLQSYHVNTDGPPVEVVSSLNRPVHEVLGFIGRHSVRVLIDSGASGNFISSGLLSNLGKLQFRRVPLRAPVRILLARGQVSMAEDAATVSLRLDTEDPAVAGIVIDNLRYDLILGQPWLRQYNPEVNWTTGEYRWTGKGAPQRVQSLRDRLSNVEANNLEVDQRPTTLPQEGKPEVNVKIVGHKHFKRILGQSKDYGVLFPIEVGGKAELNSVVESKDPVDKPIPNDYRDIIKEFQDPV
ncbi:hypothetical protein BGW39_004507, partial [Mortierella sp. 14UC]